MQGLAQFGDTRQRLLRQLLLARDGAGVEELCERLRISHNAVRQHLTTLIVSGLVQRVEPRPTGGRPQARYALTEQGRELFPRNYGAISAALISQLVARVGEAEVGAMLQELGTTVAATQVPLQADSGEALARALAQRLDALGYEAIPARHGDDWQVEAFNCVFHGLARQHPQVCKFDIAYMEAATGRRIHHMECMVRGGQVCRFKLGPEPSRGAAATGGGS
ncbi:helix-turn-helix transcriptional regulator [Luteimonas mephitis]|jgi:predicted ArsR family transcriptional regulator|uniref:helix-turn-helix transcriptional regulator n=1 Tax=Luteimonas mephitis TaxID=83615 RepID=UPI003A922568